MKNIFCTFLLIVGATLVLKAQDPQYTQFYANPLYLNPAFAGATAQGRISVNYRNQWPSLDASFITYSASYDQYIPKYQSGVGFYLSQDEVRSDMISGNVPTFKSTSFAGYYSYVAPLNKKVALQFGLSAGMISRDLGFSRLLFTDQIKVSGGEIIEEKPGGIADENNLFENNNVKNVFDVGTGFLLYSKKFWLGASVFHINKPDLSLTGINDGDRLPRRFSVQGGYVIGFSDVNRQKTDSYDFTITPAFMYLRQGASDQLSLGAYMHYQPIMLGFWYRGLPLPLYKEGTDDNQVSVAYSDAVALLVGFKLPKFTVGYSYDYTVGNTLRGNTGGSHEISLTFNFGTNLEFSSGRPKHKRFGKLYCPNPWKQYEKKRW
jgi:type IX secretion system PorP/SprF family membrane protein